MLTCIKYISGSRYDQINSDWKKDPNAAFHNLVVKEQLRFLLDQSVVIHYIDRFYRIACHPMLTEYRDYIKSLYNGVYSFLLKEKSKYQLISYDVEQGLAICNQISNLLNPSYLNTTILLKEQADIELINFFLYEQEGNPDGMPNACMYNSFVLSFLIYSNIVSRGYYKSCYTVEDDEKTLLNNCTYFPLIAPSLSSGALDVSDVSYDKYSIGTVFSPDEEILNCPLFIDFPILGYILSFNLEGVNLKQLLAKLADMCIHSDTLLFCTESHKLFYRLKSILFQYKEPSNYLYYSDNCSEALCKFISYAFEKYHIKGMDKTFVADILEKSNPCNNMTSDISKQELVDFLKCNDPSEVSSEMYNAFKNSSLKSIKKFDIVSQNLSGIAQEALDDDLDNPNDDAPSSDTSEAENDAELGDPNGDPAPSEEPKEDDTPSDGTDDDSELDDPNGDQAPSEDPDEDGDNTQETDDDTQNDTHTSPAPPSTSDKRGIVFKIASADGETVDSILFREEMDIFLKTILDNPPTSMSPQHVQLLTNLKRYWLYVLDISTIQEIVAIATKLPVVIKNIKTSNGESPQ